jgi:hypothetical protein
MIAGAYEYYYSKCMDSSSSGNGLFTLRLFKIYLDVDVVTQYSQQGSW